MLHTSVSERAFRGSALVVACGTAGACTFQGLSFLQDGYIETADRIVLAALAAGMVALYGWQGPKPESYGARLAIGVLLFALIDTTLWLRFRQRVTSIGADSGSWVKLRGCSCTAGQRPVDLAVRTAAGNVEWALSVDGEVRPIDLRGTDLPSSTDARITSPLELRCEPDGVRIAFGLVREGGGTTVASYDLAGRAREEYIYWGGLGAHRRSFPDLGRLELACGQ